MYLRHLSPIIRLMKKYGEHSVGMFDRIWKNSFMKQRFINAVSDVVGSRYGASFEIIERYNNDYGFTGDAGYDARANLIVIADDMAGIEVFSLLAHEIAHCVHWNLFPVHYAECVEADEIYSERIEFVALTVQCTIACGIGEMLGEVAITGEADRSQYRYIDGARLNGDWNMANTVLQYVVGDLVEVIDLVMSMEEIQKISEIDIAVYPSYYNYDEIRSALQFAERYPLEGEKICITGGDEWYIALSEWGIAAMSAKRPLTMVDLRIAYNVMRKFFGRRTFKVYARMTTSYKLLEFLRKKNRLIVHEEESYKDSNSEEWSYLHVELA